MKSFLFVYVDEKIFIHEFRRGRFETLKNNGEDAQVYDNAFWDWWKDKVEYKSESDFGFVILTDKEKFELPSDINIAESVEFSSKDVNDIIKQIPAGLNLISYPSGFDLKKNEVGQDAKKIKEVKVTKPGDLFKYFTNLTKEYENR